MALFNFIYKNEVLIRSLYSQIFSGFLQTVEQHETSKQREGGTAEGGLPPIAKGSCFSEEWNEKTKKEVIDPHDAALNDVLIRLKPHMKTMPWDTNFGDILHLKGDLFIIPSEIEENGVDVLFEIYVKNSKANFGGIPKNARPAMMSFLKKALASTEEGIRFLFAEESGALCRGVLTPNYLAESQKSLLFKYSNNSIPVQMVALQEDTTASTTILPEGNVLGGLHMLSGIANELYLQGLPSTIAVSPIACFYEINCKA